MFKAFVVVCFFLSINSIDASPYKGQAASNDPPKDTIIETRPELPLEEFGEKYYFLGAILKGNYFQALQFCNNYDMRLLSVETKEENDFLWYNLKRFLGVAEYNFWTSGTNLPNEHWVWLATGQPIIYTNWGPNQPDNAGNNEHCLEAKLTPNNGLIWNDVVCTNQDHVICETTLPKSVITQLTKLTNCNLTLINVPSV